MFYGQNLEHANTVDGLVLGGDEAAKLTQKEIIGLIPNPPCNINSATSALNLLKALPPHLIDSPLLKGNSPGASMGIVSGSMIPNTRMIAPTTQSGDHAPGVVLCPDPRTLSLLNL